MTPAINAARKAKIVFQTHDYEHDASAASYGLEAAVKLGLPKEQVFKTLVVSTDDNELAVGVIPVSAKLSMKRIAKLLGAKKATMADKAEVARSTGYVLGGVSSLGQKKRLRTVIDSSAMHFTTIFVSAGRRGLEIELSPDALATLTNGKFAGICHVP